TVVPRIRACRSARSRYPARAPPPGRSRLLPYTTLFRSLFLELLPRLVAQRGKFSQGRQLAQRLEIEKLEKLWRRSVQDGPPRFVLLAHHANQLALEQGLEHGPGVDPAHIVDLRARDRLAIGDDRHRLELGARQADRTLRQKASYVGAVGGVRSEREAFGHALDPHAAAFVVQAQLFEQLARALAIDLGSEIGRAHV